MRIPAHTSPETPLRLLYQDRYYVLIDKPAGMLLHRSPMARDTSFVLQTLRDQIGRRVYPVHRLDRATAGVLAFGLSPDAARQLGRLFEERAVEKRYLAVVRGWVEPSGLIDHPVADAEDRKRPRPAQTRYRRLSHVEFAHAVDRYPTARYSLVCVEPLTGRRQQIRKHFKHISHHLIGDTTHGNGRHNRFFRDQLGLSRMLLKAHRLAFIHPYSARPVAVTAPMDDEWRRLLALFGQPTDPPPRC
jgi:tRNA pseudouridine65 synthase